MGHTVGGANIWKHFNFFFGPKNFLGGFFFLFGTGSQPGSAPEVNLELNPEVGGAGGTPLAVTQEDCLVF